MKLRHVLTVEDESKLIGPMHCFVVLRSDAGLGVTALLAWKSCMWNNHVEILQRFVTLDQMLLMLKNMFKSS